MDVPPSLWRQRTPRIAFSSGLPVSVVFSRSRSSSCSVFSSSSKESSLSVGRQSSYTVSETMLFTELPAQLRGSKRNQVFDYASYEREMPDAAPLRSIRY